MVGIPSWDHYFEKHPDDLPRMIKYREKYQAMYQFPDLLDQQECQDSTVEFACSRLHIGQQSYQKLKSENLAIDPMFEIYCHEYPLPIGWWSIFNTQQIKQWYWTELGWELPTPLVENENAFVGLAKKFTTNNTIGWFLGLVKVYHRYLNNDQVFGELDVDESRYVYIYPQFEFIEGMILIEGGLDGVEGVRKELLNYKDDYDKNVFGTMITGRRFSYDSAYYVTEAIKVIKENPRLKQEILVTMIGRSLRAFQIDVKNEGYKGFRDLKSKVLNK